VTARTTPSPAALLRLDRRDRAGLTWLRNRARFWLTALKRRRKHLPRGEPYSEAEATAIRALVALEEAAGILLGQAEAGPPHLERQPHEHREHPPSQP
jgi:hypothetical protein